MAISIRSAGVALGLSVAAIAFARADAADGVDQCIVRKTDDWGTEVPQEKTVSAYVTSPADAPVRVSATGWADGQSSTGSFGIELLADDVVIGQSDRQRGDGRLDAAASGETEVHAGEQLKIAARPVGRDKAIHLVQLKIAIGSFC